MNSTTKPDAYGSLPEPATLKIQRLLPGPIERIWAYLTDSELRRKWMAAGDMDTKVGAPFELVWRNDELTDPPGERPAGFGGEHRMQSRITEFDPPRKLSITWNSTGDVTFELEPKGKGVLLTVTHRRFPDRATLLKHMAGWHMHLDVLVARASGEEPAPFWDGWSGLMKEYDARLPA
ncbi:SRPBCC family protein [Bradyrhizobium murdochi]|uniref:SRPBCC family protein n=1 Tax=Bradyrhizobium murdochi TaxID=1038859 RepID=UPI0003F86EC7|nr:SRPBCC family protein [Bradyrhizobium murdochi]